jgi:fluoride exporter
MSLLGTILAGGGSAVGAVARYSMGNAISKVNDSEFPWGTWIINMLGTFLLGIFSLAFSMLHHDLNWWLLLGTGFCGGFTTFSTMSVEIIALIKSRILSGVIYLGSSLTLGFILAWATRWWL